LQIFFPQQVETYPVSPYAKSPVTNTPRPATQPVPNLVNQTVSALAQNRIHIHFKEKV
jgi:hypothetical protein